MAGAGRRPLSVQQPRRPLLGCVACAIHTSLQVPSEVQCPCGLGAQSQSFPSRVSVPGLRASDKRASSLSACQYNPTALAMNGLDGRS